MRLRATKLAAFHHPQFRLTELYSRAGEVPSFHIAPARTGHARDLITGNLLGPYNSASPAWAVGPDGVLALPAANAPVIEYDPATLACLGARIREAVTNLLDSSENIGSASWATSLATAVINTAISPSSTLTADSLFETATTGEHQLTRSFSVASGTTYTVSVFVKANGRTTCRFGFTGLGFSGATRSTFSLSTGTVIVDAGGSPSITKYPNGWYRLSVTNTATSTTSGSIILQTTLTDNSISFAGDTSLGLHVWGAQLNTGPLAPYVPTTTLAASSTADAWSITGADFSRIYNQSAVTMYAEAVRDVVPAGEFPVLLDARTINGLEIAQISYLLEPIAGMFARTAAGIQAEQYPAAGGRTRRVAAAFAQDNFAISANGQSALVDNSGAMPIPDRMHIGSVGGGQFLNGYIREAAIIRSRRPNANLQAMTL